MKKLLLILLLLTSCTQHHKTPSPSSSELPSISTSEISSEISSTSTTISTSEEDDDPYHYRATYQKTFKKEHFNSNGGTTADLNGLVWTYSPFAYLGGATQGVQIGSSASPQTSEWQMSTVIPEGIVITSYAVSLSTANQGSAIYKVEFGSYSKGAGIVSTSTKEYGEVDLEVEATSFTLKLRANSKAIYFNSLEFTARVPIEMSFEVTTDGDKVLDPVTPGANGVPNVTYPTISVEEYYKDINFSADYLTPLKNLISEMDKRNYGDAKTILQYTDESLDRSGYTYGMWDGDYIVAGWDGGSSWNREHVWPCAQMKINGVDPRPSDSTRNHATDLHNLRVACQLANGAHSNLFLDYVAVPGLSFFPNITSGLNGKHEYKGDFRGDAARIYFYMALRYDELKLTSDLLNADELSMGNLTALLEWNLADPVDEFEIQRNNRIYQYQGNRNPFIDFPSLGNTIFG